MLFNLRVYITNITIYFWETTLGPQHKDVRMHYPVLNHHPFRTAHDNTSRCQPVTLISLPSPQAHPPTKYHAFERSPRRMVRFCEFHNRRRTFLIERA